MVPRHQGADQARERFAGLRQGREVLFGLATELPGPPPTLVRAEEPGVGQLAAGRVLLHFLAGLVLAAFHVEQVIGDLEGQAETPAVAVEEAQQAGIRAAGPLALRRPGAQAQAGPKERPRLP